MKTLHYTAISFILLAASTLSATAATPDTVDVSVKLRNDSMEVNLTVCQIETQLTFLMQGLRVSFAQPDTMTFDFPSAMMVRDKVRRHPNEVKAVLASHRKQQGAGLDSINKVVRPDVLPLVAALNDTTATVEQWGVKSRTHAFAIDVDRERAVMTFSMRVPVGSPNKLGEKVRLHLYSSPAKEDRREFTGLQLSRENAPRPNGLGEGHRKEDAARRTFQKTVQVEMRK